MERTLNLLLIITFTILTFFNSSKVLANMSVSGDTDGVKCQRSHETILDPSTTNELIDSAVTIDTRYNCTELLKDKKIDSNFMNKWEDATKSFCIESKFEEYCSSSGRIQFNNLELSSTITSWIQQTSDNQELKSSAAVEAPLFVCINRIISDQLKIIMPEENSLTEKKAALDQLSKYLSEEILFKKLEDVIYNYAYEDKTHNKELLEYILTKVPSSLDPRNSDKASSILNFLKLLSGETQIESVREKSVELIGALEKASDNAITSVNLYDQRNVLPNCSEYSNENKEKALSISEVDTSNFLDFFKRYKSEYTSSDFSVLSSTIPTGVLPNMYAAIPQVVNSYSTFISLVEPHQDDSESKYNFVKYLDAYINEGTPDDKQKREEFAKLFYCKNKLLQEKMYLFFSSEDSNKQNKIKFIQSLFLLPHSDIINFLEMIMRVERDPDVLRELIKGIKSRAGDSMVSYLEQIYSRFPNLRDNVIDALENPTLNIRLDGSIMNELRPTLQTLKIKKG